MKITANPEDKTINLVATAEQAQILVNALRCYKKDLIKFGQSQPLDLKEAHDCLAHSVQYQHINPLYKAIMQIK